MLVSVETYVRSVVNQSVTLDNIISDIRELKNGIPNGLLILKNRFLRNNYLNHLSNDTEYFFTSESMNTIEELELAKSCFSEGHLNSLFTYCAESAFLSIFANKYTHEETYICNEKNKNCPFASDQITQVLCAMIKFNFADNILVGFTHDGEYLCFVRFIAYGT